MKYAFGAAALLATASAAQAGGLERSNQSVAFMFEQGSYGEVSFSHVDADVSGTATAPYGGQNSGDMSSSYRSFGFAFKTDVNDRLSLGVQFEQPYGADLYYPNGTGYPLAGSNADLDTDEIKLVLKYKMDGGFSVYGGLRMQQVDGNVALPFQGYTLSVPTSSELGYLVGAAYEKPEIAMRIAVTYFSEVKHTLSSTENGTPTGTFESTFPQAINLEAQSGIAKDTLLLGSIRWVDWSEFDITPPGYALATGGGSLVNYTDDVFTYTLGVARRLTENFSGIATVSYEKQNGGYSGNLGPTDGRTSIGLAGRYSVGKATITGGVNYSWLGDTQTRGPNPAAPTLANFQDNTAFGVGVRIGYSF